MDEVNFLPTFPLFAANMMLVGAVLLCGLATGHVFARYLRLPRITGFVAAGLVLGPGMLNLLDKSTLTDLSIFVDISLGLILFQLGRWLAETLDILVPHALALGSGSALAEIRASLDPGENDSGWLRDTFSETKSLSDVVRLQSRLWAGEQRSQPDR